MVRRTFWQARIAEAWRQRSVVWLMGVRRVGKSVLCQSLPDIRRDVLALVRRYQSEAEAASAR